MVIVDAMLVGEAGLPAKAVLENWCVGICRTLRGTPISMLMVLAQAETALSP